MIISASRRTDIPAFYAPWLVNRLRQGYCTVPNPFNRKQISRVSLLPQDVDVIVFWTRNPRPLMKVLDAVEHLGHTRYYFQFTILDNPTSMDPKSPSTTASIDTFKALADRIGPGRVVWRYDPVVFTPTTTVDYHRAAFDRLAGRLQGYTRRVVVSVVDRYKKAEPRIRALDGSATEFLEPASESCLAPLFTHLASSARACGLAIESCAEEIDLRRCGIEPGRCVDDRLVREEFALDVTRSKDAGQRPACGCVSSRDIGMYDSCLYGCQYCYATRSFERARLNHGEHDPESPSLIGHH